MTPEDLTPDERATVAAGGPPPDPPAPSPPGGAQPPVPNGTVPPTGAAAPNGAAAPPRSADDTEAGTTKRRDLSSRMAKSASQLFVRRILVQLLSAVSTAVLARTLGIDIFGALSAGMATYYVLSSVCDFGFGLVLGRELGAGRANDGTLVRSMIQVVTAWSGLVALGGVGVALATGLRYERADVLLALVPTIALSGLGSTRQVFYATYTTARLGFIDVLSNVVQAVLVSGVALLTRSAIDVSIVMSATIILNSVVVLHFGRRLLDDGQATSAERRRLFRMALPLGAGSLLASAYFTIDLSIVAYLVPSKQVGYYAAATKALSVLVTIPGLVMTAALAGLSQNAKDREDLGQLLARVWHWLAAIALPMCVGVIVFARRFVELYFGTRYAPAVSLTQILAASAVVALLSNVFGNAMVATRRTTWLIVQGALALVLNVGGNLLLVPRYGVTASAWLTLVTEAVVCAGSVIGIAGRVDFRPLVRASKAPVLAVAALLEVGLALRNHVFVGVPVAGAAFLLVLVVLGGWPEEFPPIVPLRLRRLVRR